MIKKKPLLIKCVEPGSLADKKGIKSGDYLISINGHVLRDSLDYEFYSHEVNPECKFAVGDKIQKISFLSDGRQALGLQFNPMQFGYCGNKCVFCFIDQNPRGLRDTLYIKDEDYRLSFLFGNYVSLTRITRDELNRIVEQRLSPLYVSVHATDLEVRKHLLGIRKDDRLLEKIAYLAKNHIQIHGQIVLCPGINDGQILKDTLNDLHSFYPQLQSMAVVPVGLTRHREKLPSIKPVTPVKAREIIKQVKGIQKEFRRKCKDPFVFLADEFYLLAGVKLPPEKHYKDFWQIDNGVGLTRAFITECRESLKTFPRRIVHAKEIVLVTGTLAEPVLEQFLVRPLNRIKNLKAGIVSVPNQFYGSSVTVSGLLTGVDILRTCKSIQRDVEFLLPSNCLNSDSLFLDDFTPERLEVELKRKVRVIENINKLLELYA